MYVIFNLHGKMTRSRKKFPHAQSASVSDFLSLIAGVHLSSYVDSPFQDRGGLMLVGPPGSLKSTCVNFLDRSFPDALVLSDLNVQSLVKIKEQVIGGTLKTLVLPELQKIYDRHPQTASNIEGHLAALVAEGFRAASFENQTILRKEARATVIAAMTHETQEAHADKWQSKGFARRFLWALVSLQDPLALDRAVLDGKLLEISMGDAPRVPVTGFIPNLTTIKERHELQVWIKYQPTTHTIQLSLLVKVWAVMKWWAGQQKRSEGKAWEVLRRASHAFGKNGVELVID